jgi:hypothetical protein
MCALPIPFLGSILAAVFGHMALAEYARTPGQLRGRGLAIAGVVMGYVTLALQVIAVILIVLFIWVLPHADIAVPGR